MFTRTISLGTSCLISGCLLACSGDFGDATEAAMPEAPSEADEALKPLLACPLLSKCYWVTNTNDTGPGSLRQALLDANADVGADTVTRRIRFAIPGAGPHTIRPVNYLPVAQGPIHIEGYTQSGAVEATDTTPPVLQIVLDGSSSTGFWGLNLSRGGSTVSGLVINNFVPGSGIVVNSDDNTIWGNYIGVDATGTAAMPNAQAAVNINGGSGNVIGGTEAKHRNVLSGNGVQGVLVFGPGNVIQGNSIGTSFDGALDLGNGHSGVALYGVGNNLVGGVDDGEGNLIAYNGGDGVAVFAGSGNQISRNSVYANDGLGIDLTDDGVTHNDGAPDADNGANGLQNFPRLESVSLDATGKATVDWLIRSLPNTLFRVEFYENDACDPSGRGEGRRFLGSRAIRTDGAGRVTNTWTLPGITSTGKFLTAVAVNIDANSPEYWNTSEFSPCLEVP